MASDVQITANRENGKLGGVKTERGKAVIRFNARKHGILATLLTKYEEEDLQSVGTILLFQHRRRRRKSAYPSLQTPHP